jgi:hypothetical protein
MYVRARCNLRHSKDLADFIEREPLFVSQRNRHSLFGAQLVQSRFERLAERLSLDWVRRGWPRQISNPKALAGSLVWNVNRYVRRSCPPQGIQSGVVSDSKEPARQPSRCVERGKIPERFDKCFLRQVFGLGEITRHPRDEPDHRSLVTADNLLEG